MALSRLVLVVLLMAAALSGCTRAYPDCEINWAPSALAPVFYGVQDHGPADGAPTPLRVFYPSLDGATQDAPPLDDCGPFPAIVFAHGQCMPPGGGATLQPTHYQSWFLHPAQLARSGYVVVVPSLPHAAPPWGTPNEEVRLIGESLTWLRTQWANRSIVMPEPATGVIGHSFGAMAGALYARDHPSPYVSLSGPWLDWDNTPRPIAGLTRPSLFIFGQGAPLDQVYRPDVAQGLWDQVPGPTHAVALGPMSADPAGHWDHLPARSVSCQGADARGACTTTHAVSRDVVTTFFARYLPTRGLADPLGRIGLSLQPPALSLTPEQQFYAGNHLTAFSGIQGRPECETTLLWRESGGQVQSVVRP